MRKRGETTSCEEKKKKKKIEEEEGKSVRDSSIPHMYHSSWHAQQPSSPRAAIEP